MKFKLGYKYKDKSGTVVTITGISPDHTSGHFSNDLGYYYDSEGRLYGSMAYSRYDLIEEIGPNLEWIANQANELELLIEKFADKYQVKGTSNGEKDWVDYYSNYSSAILRVKPVTKRFSISSLGGYDVLRQDDSITIGCITILISTAIKALEGLVERNLPHSGYNNQYIATRAGINSKTGFLSWKDSKSLLAALREVKNDE